MIRFEQSNKFSDDETVSMVCNEFLYTEIQERLKNNSCIKVILRNKIFYCYEEFYPEYLNIDFALQQLKHLKCLFLQQLWQNHIESIVFRGCNEWVLGLVPLLRNERISTRVEGEIWKNIYGEMTVPQSGRKDKVVDTCGTDHDLYHEFSWVMDILQFQRWRAMNETKVYLSRLGAEAFTCVIPEFKDLDQCTAEEKFRNLREINITNGRIDFEDQDVIAHLQKVYGRNFREIRQKRGTESVQHWIEAVCDAEYYLKNRRIYAQGVNRCYLIGPCIVEGNTLSPGENFPEIFQSVLNEYMSEKYAVMTISLPFYVVDSYLEIVKYLAIRANDIIICIDEVSLNCVKAGNIEPDVDLKELYDRRGKEEWFADKPIHTTAFANNMLARHLVRSIKEKHVMKGNCLLQPGKGYLSHNEVKQIDEYLASIDRFLIVEPGERIGAIVMNCNPITLGHEFLIDYARTQVDFLYIFVVQEDKSYIPFEDRIAMVRLYTRQYENIKVNPSGMLILSSRTMPMYFEKEEKRKMIVDAWKDIEIFSQYIAPRLEISVRFVGEEKTDMITWQYNREMERTLNDYGIELREISRKEIDGVAVSASNVREFLKEKKWNKLSKMVSRTTCAYLQNKYIGEEDISRRIM